jgi:hypothetical protein
MRGVTHKPALFDSTARETLHEEALESQEQNHHGHYVD